MRCAQEIAPFLRVLGCYPMDLDAGDFRAASVQQEDLGGDDRSLNGSGRQAMRTDDLLMAVTGASVRMPIMQVHATTILQPCACAPGLKAVVAMHACMLAWHASMVPKDV